MNTIAILSIKRPTVLKRSPTQSSELPAAEKYPIAPDHDPLAIAAYKEEAGHLIFTLADELLQGKNTWYAWIPDVEVKETTPRKGEAKAISFVQKPKELGQSIQVPGLSLPIYLNTPIGRSKSFYWYEALHGGDRLPADAGVTGGIIRIAETLQPFRDELGKSFVVTSWYRDRRANDTCGGASNSRHLYGDAIDFYVEGMSTYQLYNWFEQAGWWQGLGKYSGMDIVHVDARGFGARWWH